MIELSKLQEIILTIPAVLIAFSFHEFAHAWVATKFGDDTPRLQGRVTLDPRSHIDWLGFILIIIGGFGWARPVMVNTSKLRPRILGDLLVSLAGVTMNFLLAILFGLLTIAADRLNAPFVATAMQYIMILNLWMVAFNVLPIPPLDGFHVIKYVLPESLQQHVPTIYRYGPYLLLLLILTDKVNVLLGPIMSGVMWAWSMVMTPVFALLG
ncbi:MAG TPA: site-2 protease family protein [Symbiobacteriaceae bacterium]|nr:site-2 protease family protein [Symbiobacteriaceae bacterium]